MSATIFPFGTGNGDMKVLLGGKGASLHEMVSLGLPVPPGFTLTTEACLAYYKASGKLPTADIAAAIKALEQSTGKAFGDAKAPLLVSVRSGARASMPGMMDTLLNVGLNDMTVQAFADQHFANDCYARLICGYAVVVDGLDRDEFADTVAEAGSPEEAVKRVKALYESLKGKPFPQDPNEQMTAAIGAVFNSWHGARAIAYRRLHSIPDDWGTACNVQAMVFGNAGDDCATGVCFTRHPSTGERRLFGEYLPNAQGEEIVSGSRTPLQIQLLQEKSPAVFAELQRLQELLERHFKDMQDIEFTVEHGKLWLLQTRSGKRTARAALRIAVDLVKDGFIDERTAVLRVEPEQIEKLLHPNIDPEAKRKIIGKGLPASPGAASGYVVFSSEDAISQTKAGRRVLLVRIETSPEDIHGMSVAQGILTQRGGMTSHAAVVARGMGRVCVVGAEIRVDYAKREMVAGGITVREGDLITIDGSSGEIMAGEVRTIVPELGEDFHTLLGWADSFRKLRVRANCDTPKDAEVALTFGAEGIGLCRTEHMFFAPDRMLAMRELILAGEERDRKRALQKLEPMQRADFLAIFEIMGDRPVTVRLLDPPLHEFLPGTDEEIEHVSKALGMPTRTVRQRRDALREINPMLGHRGVRLGITWPEIYEMQIRAVLEAVTELKKKGVKTQPEIMFPLVCATSELTRMHALADKIAADVREKTGINVDFHLGTMIEVPRAALVAGELAQHAQFFSFGTNDLTQTALGLSRDDAGKFLNDYVDQGLLDRDPFVSIDQAGVGELMRIACERGRKTRPDLELGLCGEHGSDPRSIAFCSELGLHYVSCSPYRVAAARLAAAQVVARTDVAGTVAVQDKV